MVEVGEKCSEDPSVGMLPSPGISTSESIEELDIGQKRATWLFWDLKTVLL